MSGTTLGFVSNVPSGHLCAACGAGVEQVMTDWADDGRRLVVDEAPLWCSECSASSTGRQVRVEGSGGRSEISVEGGFGARLVELRVQRGGRQ